jgi:outer membrane protein
MRSRTSRLLCAAFTFLLAGPAISSAQDNSIKAEAPLPPVEVPRDEDKGDLKKQLAKEAPVLISLQDAMLQSIEKNIDVAISRLGPGIAEGGLLVARGPFDPTFGVEGGYGETSQPRLSSQIAADGISDVGQYNTTGQADYTLKTAPGTQVRLLSNASNQEDTFNGFSDEFSSFAGAEITQPLLRNFGSDTNLAEVRIARKELDRSKLDFYNSVETIVQDVGFSYYDLLFALADVDAQTKSLELAEQTLADNEARVQLGVMTPLDISQARTEVAGRETILLQSRQLVVQSENALKSQITNDLGSWLNKRVSPTESLTPPEPTGPVEYQIAKALQNRQDYLAALNFAEQRDLRLKFQRNQILPQLDLLTTFGFNGLSNDLGQSLQNTYAGKNATWFVGFRFDIPWDNRAARGQLQIAEQEKKRAILEIKKLEQSIIVDVDNAAKDVETSSEQVKSTRTARIFAEESVRAEEERLKEGASTSFVVLQLQRDLATARTAELRALSAYHKSVVRLQRSEGTLLADRGIILVDPSMPGAATTPPTRRSEAKADTAAPAAKTASP